MKRNCRLILTDICRGGFETRPYACRRNASRAGALATAGFGWALVQTHILPSWVGWVTLVWGLVFAAISLRMAMARAVRDTPNAIPLLPMVMQLVIGIALLVK